MHQSLKKRSSAELPMCCCLRVVALLQLPMYLLQPQQQHKVGMVVKLAAQHSQHDGQHGLSPCRGKAQQRDLRALQPLKRPQQAIAHAAMGSPPGPAALPYWL